VRGLAEHQVRAGTRVTIIMPLYRSVRDRGTELEPVGDPFVVRLGTREDEARVYRATCVSGPTVYFIEQDRYFDRPGVYGELADYPDNAHRFAFFCMAALRAIPDLRPDATVLHAHDWHTALSIIYLRYVFAGLPAYDQIASVLTVHNGAFQGHFPLEMLAEIGLPASLYDWRWMEWYGRVNILKGGLAFADMITTVSPSHAAELCTPEGGFGLHEHFRYLRDRFVGIVNGIDTVLWDPANDPELTARYSVDDLAAKQRCKKAAQRRYGLPQRQRVPLVAMSARLVEQKGFDLILTPDLLRNTAAQFVFLGRGEPYYENALAVLAQSAPEQIAVPLVFTERLEHRLLAGSDLLLMPSRFEPCGLTQMRAQRYGSLPIVRHVGGLADTVVNGTTGFMFHEYEPSSFDQALQRAVKTYEEPRTWSPMVRRAMRRDFSWRPSEQRYLDVYRRAETARVRR